MNNLNQSNLLLEELETLLSEDIASVIQREQTTFDNLITPFNKDIVLVGAGNLGKQVLQQLRQEGIEPLAFTDNNPKLWNQNINGLIVLSPEDAALKFGQKAVFVVTIWSTGHRFIETKQRLNDLNCIKVVSILSFRWKHPDVFLPCLWADSPHKIYQNSSSIIDAFSLWSDDFSRQEYLAQIRWNALAEFDKLSSPFEEESYFLDSIFTLLTNEVFVDCGAYDGDTLCSFISRQSEYFNKFIALEPDPINFNKLKSYTSELHSKIRNKVKISPLVVGSKKEIVNFSLTTNSAVYSVNNQEKIEVECDTLDNILSDCIPTYIKMDIEGFEIEALLGASQVISQHAPILAICVYHQQDHLWRVPLLIKSLYSDYKFFLRPHEEDGWQTVCYAVPNNRLNNNYENGKLICC